MLIVDSEVAPRWFTGGKVEKEKDRLRTWVAEQTAHSIYLNNMDLSVANPQRQLGQTMWPNELEARLKRLDPNFIFEVNPHKPSMKMLYYVRRPEGKKSICPYHNHVMPEHSVMRVKEEIVRDMSVNHLNRKDLPKHEFRPGANGAVGEYVWDPTAVLPGTKKVNIPWGEAARGWRTVLIRIVEEGILTPTQVENAFGADDRPEWASHMGKHAIQLPW